MKSIWGQLILQLILIFLNAVFACAEIAVLSVNEAKITKLEENGNKRAKKLRRLTEQPAKFHNSDRNNAFRLSRKCVCGG